MLAVLAEARARSDAGGSKALPVFNRLIGIEARAGVARLASAALGDEADILHADATTLSFPECSAVLIFDVLHMMPARHQVQVLAGVRAALRHDGVVLVREADPTAGWRFEVVRIANRLKALLGGTWRPGFCFRHPDDWGAVFREAGFVVERPASLAKGPLGNTLFRLLIAPRASEAEPTPLSGSGRAASCAPPE
jgi:hypothetical protein